MSSSYISYDPSAFFPPRDPPDYDMAAALDLKPIAAFLADPFMLEDFQSRLMQPSMHQNAEPQHPFPYDSHSNFPPSPYSSNPVSIFDVRRTHEIRHPTPVRPVSTAHLYSSANLMDIGGHLYESQPSSFSNMPLSDPSSMVVEPTAHTVAPGQAQPPPPPPSWSMSGSLDPLTGIYQSAPEHPRVRTAQACDKCRGRKAKCSGEHPICERCRLRGLKCEYAAERKMRGPNKVKRKTAAAAADSKAQRRASVASESSSTPGSSRVISRSPFTTVPRALQPSPPAKKEMAPPPHPEVGAGSQPPQGGDKTGNGIRASKKHPTHIDLTGTHMYDNILAVPEIPFVDEAHLSAHRRASLPSHVLEAYAYRQSGDVYSPPRGIEVVDAHVRPHSNPLYHTHGSFADSMSILTTAVHSSASDASSSNPMTPMSEDELLYPLSFHPGVGVSHGDMNFSGFEEPFLDHGFMGHQQGWSSFDIDTTPTEAVDDRDKSPR